MKKIDLRSLLDRYLEILIVEKGLSENTIEAYTRDLERFLAFLKDKSLELKDINETKVFLYIVEIRKEGLSGSSLARHLSSLRGFFTFALEEEALDEDPARFLENPKIIRDLPVVLSQSEMQDLLEVPDTSTKLGFRNRAMLELMYAAGLRVSEVCSIRPLDFDSQTNLVKVFGKGSKERFVPVHEEAGRILNDYLTHWRPLFTPKDKVMFLNRSGKGLSRVAVWKMVQNCALKAQLGTDISPHTLRHCFATHLLEGGADLRSVQMLLGHSDIAATEIYTHVQKDYLVKTHSLHHPRSEQD